MGRTAVLFYCDADGRAPALDWLDDLARQNRRAYLKCRESLERLAMLGHELRRPTADHLQDGIYELRVRVGRVNFRILYFFHGRSIAVLAHALTKEQEVPKHDLARAAERRELFESNPKRHTYVEGKYDA